LEEAEVATEWYRLRSVRAAEMFVDELDRAIERIGRHPGQSPEYAFGTRRMVLQRFPYLVVFRETAAGIEIIAVAHGRRRPGYWRDRVE
jgi:toxin ParE1/3/4